ncbi:MAG TPA: hypothetical protein VG939_05245 [Caulobacteraceae bacterium]|nr:hypothetical protein [Caulobacteraceae bacterium]
MAADSGGPRLTAGLAGMAILAAGVAAGLTVLAPAPSRAATGLQVGACVVADKRNPGRIVQVLPYGYVVQGFGPNHSPMMWPLSDVVPGPCEDTPTPAAGTPDPVPDGQAQATAQVGGGACFASDGPQGAGLQGRIAAVLVRGFSHEPQPGEDGRITVHVQSLRTGASRGASPVDAVQYQTRAGSTMYDVRATFQTCTDYNSRLVLLQRERNFVCFTKASGVFDCSMTGNTPGLAQDVTREIPKRR